MTLKINGATGGSVSIDAPDNTSPAGTDVTLTLPTTAGSSGQVLTTDGSGTLSFTTLASDSITEGNTSVECVDTGSNGHITFDTEGTEHARIDSSGRLLLGSSTNNSGYKLQVVHSNSGVLLGCFNGGTNYLSTLSSNGSEASKTIVSNGQDLFVVNVTGYDGSANRTAATITARVDGTPGASDMPGRLIFATTSDGSSSPAERMRIRSNGEISISNSVHVVPSTDNSVPLGLSTNRWSAVWAANGTIQTSDKRTKTDVANSVLASDFIKSLRPVSYKWIEGGKVDTGERDEDSNYIYESVPGQRTHWGFIAQEVKEAADAAGVDFGGWVLTDKDDPDSEQALRYDQFIAPLTKALQEALAKIETLETANASQAATIAAFEARLTALEGGAA